LAAGEGSFSAQLLEARDRVAFLVETLQLSEDNMAEMKRQIELGKAREQQWDS
jgi:hypothetical protein